MPFFGPDQPTTEQAAAPPMGSPFDLSSYIAGKPGAGKKLNLIYHNVYKPFIDAARYEQDLLFGAAHATQNDLMKTLQGGFKDARTNIAEQGRIGTQGIMDAQTQSIGANQQAATSAGLSGSSAHRGANRGAAADAARQIAALNTGLGQLYSQLDVGEAQALAGAQAGQGALFQNQAGAGMNLLSSQLAAMNQVPFEVGQPKESWAGGLLGGLGAAAGGLFQGAGAAGGLGPLFAGL